MQSNYDPCSQRLIDLCRPIRSVSLVRYSPRDVQEVDASNFPDSDCDNLVPFYDLATIRYEFVHLERDFTF